MPDDNEKMEWINQADADELASVEGIDKNKAEDIINHRDKEGGFKSWEDLKKVPGINDQMIEKLKQEGEDAA